MHFVYILKSHKDGSYYIGYTSNLEQRLKKHNNSKSGYTSKKKPWVIVYHERYSTKLEAIKREKFIKNQRSRVFIETLID